jgi:hypothetical protein
MTRILRGVGANGVPNPVTATDAAITKAIDGVRVVRRPPFRRGIRDDDRELVDVLRTTADHGGELDQFVNGKLAAGAVVVAVLYLVPPLFQLFEDDGVRLVG